MSLQAMLWGALLPFRLTIPAASILLARPLPGDFYGHWLDCRLDDYETHELRNNKGVAVAKP